MHLAPKQGVFARNTISAGGDPASPGHRKSELGPTFLIRALKDHALVRVGLAAFRPLTGGLPRVVGVGEAIENPACSGPEPNVEMRSIRCHD